MISIKLESVKGMKNTDEKCLSYADSNVLDYEPHLALFVDDNTPLIFYKAICKIAFENLHSKGFCFMEINEALGPDTQLLFEGNDFQKTALKKDAFGKDRMLKTQKK